MTILLKQVGSTKVIVQENFYTIDEKLIDVYQPGQAVRTFGIDDALEEGDLLPEFKLTIRDLFGILE